MLAAVAITAHDPVAAPAVASRGDHALSTSLAETGALLSGIAALLWPALLVVVLLILRRQIRGIADSVGRRGGSVKLAGFEVTIAEATEQQQKLIADLQVQLGYVQNRLDDARRAGTAAATGATIPPGCDAARADDTPDAIPGLGAGFDAAGLLARRRPAAQELLWVDGHAAGSAAFQATLQDYGFTIVNVDSLEAALSYVAAHSAALIVTRMSLHGEPGAGVILVEKARQVDALVTVAILAPGAAIARRGAEALAAGAAFVTASPAELIRFLARLSGG